MANPHIQVHTIGPRGTIIKISMKRGTLTYNDMAVESGQTLVTKLNVYRIGTDLGVLNVAASRKSEALNITKQLDREVKMFLEPEEAPRG